MARPERERDRDRDRNILSEPGGRRRSLFPQVTLDSETFGKFAEWVAQSMGTATFLLYMTVFVIVWIVINLVGLFGFRWDPYPFILLNLFFSTQASYAAPLIMLAQNRQEMRDKLSLDQDREMARQSRADMDFLAREIAAIRMSLGELTTRDFVRGELRGELRDLETRLNKVDETDE